MTTLGKQYTYLEKEHALSITCFLFYFLQNSYHKNMGFIISSIEINELLQIAHKIILQSNYLISI